MRKDSYMNKKKSNLLGVGALLFYFCSILPLLWICKYSHMCADDYGYGIKPHNAFLKTGKMADVMAAACDTVKGYYEVWQGTYSSLFLFSLQPGIFGEKYYKYGPLFLILLLSIAMFWFGYVLLVQICKMDKNLSFLLLSLWMVVSVQKMHAPVQAFYFYNAGVHYIFMHALLLFYLTAFIRVLFSKEVKKGIYGLEMLLLVFLAGILGGGNYITVFIAILLSFTFSVLYLFYSDEKKKLLWCVPGQITLIIGFIISAIAPGNQVRSERSDGVGPIKAILLSLRFSVERLPQWLDIWTILLFVLIFILALKLIKNMNYSFSYPLLVAGYSFCLYAASFTPTCYAMGYPGAGRCNNVYQLFFYLLVFFNLIYIAGWVQKKEKLVNLRNALSEKKISMLVKVVLILALCILPICGDWNQYMSLCAVKSVYYKEAQLFDVVRSQREEILNTSEEKKLTLPAYNIYPKLLFFDDITTDPKDWRNVSCAKWYKKKKIQLADHFE